MKLEIFDFNEQPVRVVDREGSPWFVATDVCRVLEIGNPTESIRSLDEDEKTTLSNTEGQAGRGAQAYNIVSESGLYTLIFKSRKPQAKAFRKWVTSEVLPAIRKTGSYISGAIDVPCLENPEEPLGTDAMERPTTIPEFVRHREEVAGWRMLDHIRYGKMCHLLAKAWGVPFGRLSVAGIGQVRAFPEGLLHYVLCEMPARTVLPAIEGPDVEDFKKLVSFLTVHNPDTSRTPRKLREIAASLGLFRSWLTIDSVDSPAAHSRFGKLCHSFHGQKFGGWMFQVSGKKNLRTFMLKRFEEVSA